MTNQDPPSESPVWSPTTKLVVGLTIVAAIAAFLIQFRQIIGPLILAFVLAFLLHPVAALINSAPRLSWRTSVNLLYLVLVIVLAALMTLAGLAIVQQIQSLVSFVQRFTADLPGLISDLSMKTYSIGNFELDLSQYDLRPLADQLLGVVQPIVGQAGSLVSKFATGAATTLGWGAFVLLVSYFLLAEAGRVPESLLHIEIPGYNVDTRRLGSELLRTWNAFLRGQLVISILVIISYSILLAILGTRFTLAIAILAGAARFVPYIGPFTTWTITALVTFFQAENYFNLEPWKYMLLVVVACLVLDQIFDNLVNPRLMGQTLGVHPAGVLISAIVVTNLIGIIGLVLAAPLLATLNLLTRYVLHKMFDLDPWPEEERVLSPPEMPWANLVRRFRAWLRLRIIRRKLRK